MAYTITTTAGVTIASINDGTVNASATSLTLIGKNYAGYGVFLNENYIKLLENFSNTTAPLAPLAGQLWYDSTNTILKVYSNNAWKGIASSFSGTSQPLNPVIGDFWWDTTNAQLKVWSGSIFVTVGPTYTATTGTSGAVVETVVDVSLGSHIVVKFYISNTVVGIISKDSAFTPQTSISGFTTIKPGFNLISSSTLTNAAFSGDSSNALLLNGVASNQFLRSDTASSTIYTLGVGALDVGSDLEVRATSGTVNLTNATTNGALNLWVTKGTGGLTKAIGITGSTAAVAFAGAVTASTTLGVTGALTASSTLAVTGQSTFNNTIKPNSNNTVNIGLTGTRFANIYAKNVIATTFYGNLIGTATEALYADLAERFEADFPMIPGTVVELGGTKEVTAVSQDLSEDVFGVISTNPAYLMNSEAGTNETHPPIALSGRVPVRVIGKVKKGDRLVSAGNGVARTALKTEINAFNVIGRSLNDKETDSEETIEAIVKVNT